MFDQQSSTDRPISQHVLSLVDLLWSVRTEKRRAGVEGADLVNTLAFRVGMALAQVPMCCSHASGTQMDNLTSLEANHFRQLAQLALDFNLDAKMATEGETSPPELESLNRRVRPLPLLDSSAVLTCVMQRGTLAQLLVQPDSIPRSSQSEVFSGSFLSRQYNDMIKAQKPRLALHTWSAQARNTPATAVTTTLATRILKEEIGCPASIVLALRMRKKISHEDHGWAGVRERPLRAS